MKYIIYENSDFIKVWGFFTSEKDFENLMTNFCYNY